MRIRARRNKCVSRYRHKHSVLVGHVLHQLGRCNRRLIARYFLSGEIPPSTRRRFEFHLEQPFTRKLPTHKAILSEAAIRFLYQKEV